VFSLKQQNAALPLVIPKEILMIAISIAKEEAR
jgi:hypothetical protein